ncbi:P-loop containing nucleoside triphosphate hydrolase protein [Tuber brumale]|nr:P-loop containing nucleoside triphosphate hydrolase protein [Tuber brumale]
MHARSLSIPTTLARSPGLPSTQGPSFVPRREFPYPSNLITSYFLGHHRAGLDRMKQLVSSVDLIIECRDYRVPLSSRNPMFEEALQEKERLIVYTKRDLAAEELDLKAQETIRKWHRPHEIIFSDSKDRKDVQKIIDYAKGTATAADNMIGSRMLVVGMPNVGKSTLLNAMRRVGTGNSKKAAITGGQPGVTRKISMTVRISDDPLIYLMDSPGVFVPYMPNPQTMLSLALVGCVKDSLLNPTTLADYLLFHLNLRDPSLYSGYCPPTNDIVELLTATAKATGRLLKGGTPDFDATAYWLVQRYRASALGKFILDDVSETAYQAWLDAEEKQGESKNAARKRMKEERKLAKIKKRRDAEI